MPETHGLTNLLDAARLGDADAADRLWRTVYHELRGMAQAQMGKEHGPRTLQPTALVNEAYLRLMGGGEAHFENRKHFFAAAAEAMRRILVEGARKRGRIKRGEGKPMGILPVDPAADRDPLAGHDPDELMDVNDVLDRLARQHPREAQVVMQRYIIGLSVEETAQVLGIATRTVEKDWAFARAWLKRALAGE